MQTPSPHYGPTNPEPAVIPRTFCAMVELRPDKEEEYRRLHADVWPEVLAAIRRANIRNYNIYVATVGGRRYLVSHMEYTGSNPAADFATIAKDAVTRDKWWPLTDACQQVLEGTPEGQQWLPLERVMHVP